VTYSGAELLILNRHCPMHAACQLMDNIQTTQSTCVAHSREAAYPHQKARSKESDVTSIASGGRMLDNAQGTTCKVNMLTL
jgi:hypothetical protein